MKKITLALVFWFLAVFAMAQSAPIIGYDRVEWGVSVEAVRQAYSIPSSVELRVYTQDHNIRYLVQENISESIKRREFNFIEDKLYSVEVYYNNTSDSTAGDLLSILTNRFGNRTDFDIETGTTTVMFQRVNFTRERSTFGRYSPDLVVEMVHYVIYAGIEKDTRNLLGQNQLYVVYRWKKFRDEYQSSRLGL
jgi:hypothetical protein